MHAETPLICIAYLSSSKVVPDAQALEAIVSTSQKNNAARGVTGMLCHYDGSYLQFLEGEPQQLLSLYEVIRGDPRHMGIVEVFREPITERMFPDWTMALAKPEEIGAEHRAFCRSLRALELVVGPEHRKDLEPFLACFRDWMR